MALEEQDALIEEERGPGPGPGPAAGSTRDADAEQGGEEVGR